MRLNKNIKFFFNYFLGPLLFVWLCFSIYRQIGDQPHLEASWLHIKNAFYDVGVFYFLGVILLMVLNWGLEAAKWKMSVAVIHPLSFIQSFKAVLTGVSFAVSTPNRVGEYVGRMLYMPEGKRLKVIAITLVGSMSQILVTFYLGLLGFIRYRAELTARWPVLEGWDIWIIGSLGLVIVILTLFYFNLSFFENWLESRFRKRSWLFLVEAIRSFGTQRLSKLLLLSLARYIVFAIQYVLLFHLFEVHVTASELFWMMTVVFLVLAAIPSIALVELGVRGEVSLQLIGLLTSNGLGILLTSVAAWFINLIIPALAGSLFILGLRVFKRYYPLSQRKKVQKAEA
ncbi:MAG TPA: lysylphosphatidylglycerol synthase domain-containing protein [Flavisolibacter sp.]|nr:lysylphosphatidylglycerol synthase domain-containing protein [Flavisolibacter sp.]